MNSHGRLRRGTHIFGMLAVLFCSGPLGLWAADRFVVPPGTIADGSGGVYTNWGIAATQIQWAVDAAAAGETVWVSNGTYRLTNYLSITKGIALRGVNGPDMTIINGNYPAYTNQCLYMNHLDAWVDGFTITNGFCLTLDGGGVHMRNGIISNCIISGNTAKDRSGGGITMYRGGTTTHCFVSGNISTGTTRGAGGVYCCQGGVIKNSTIAWNSAIITNSAGDVGGGGGVSCSSYNLTGTVVNCVILSNTLSGAAALGGGGVFCYPSGKLVNSIISGNTSTNKGGGVCLRGVPLLPIMQNCLVCNNTCEVLSGGAGLATYYAFIIQNCTIVNNHEGTAGWYHYNDNSGYFSMMANCIIVSNYTDGTLGNWLMQGGNPLTNLSITNTCTYPTNFDSRVVRSGCISNDPSFANYSAGDYRLSNNSPCINTGANQDWMTGAFDLDGRMRIRYGVADMGAYEFICAGSIYSCH